MYDQVEMVLNRPLGRLSTASGQSFSSEAEKPYPCLLYNGALCDRPDKSSVSAFTSDVCEFRGYLNMVDGNSETDNKDALIQRDILYRPHSIDFPQSASRDSSVQASFDSKIDKPTRGIRSGWIGRGTRHVVDGALCCLPQRKHKTV